MTATSNFAITNVYVLSVILDKYKFGVISILKFPKSDSLLFLLTDAVHS